jgi:hypothetical protein
VFDGRLDEDELIRSGGRRVASRDQAGAVMADEVRRHVPVSAEAIDRRIAFMNDAFEDALVTGSSPDIPTRFRWTGGEICRLRTTSGPQGANRGARACTGHGN